MAGRALNEKVSKIKERPFFVLIAEQHNKEQLSIRIHWINCTTLTIYEDFLGFYEISNIKSTTVVTVTTKMLSLDFSCPFRRLEGKHTTGKAT